jgi:predicted metal-dependent enzyme (double-stranded beta helix superfamily)
MADEFICDASEVRSFISKVKGIMRGTVEVTNRLAAIQPHFSQMIADRNWLPEEFRRTYDAGGMGKGIANWLLYRDTEGLLSLSALVLSPGAVTPVHDHLAWGLVGLYAGQQDEEVYEPAAPVGPNDRRTNLKLVAKNRLEAGSFYKLIPPTGDIHRVITIGAEPSISLHLLGNDVGCVLRHRFEPETGEVAPFRSGYTNRDCETDGRSTA